MNQGVELVHEITQVDIERLAWEPIRVRKNEIRKKKGVRVDRKRRRKGGFEDGGGLRM